MRRHSMLPSSSKPQVDAFTFSLTSDTVDEAFFSTLQASKQIAMGSIQSTLCVRRQEGYTRCQRRRAAHLLRTSAASHGPGPALGPGRGWRARLIYNCNHCKSLLRYLNILQQP